MATSAPARASANVISRPTRTAAPVTRATLPERGASGTLHRNLWTQQPVFRLKDFRFEKAMKKILFFRLAALAAGLCLSAPARAGSVSRRGLDSTGRPLVGAQIVLLSHLDQRHLRHDLGTRKEP